MQLPVYTKKRPKSRMLRITIIVITMILTKLTIFSQFKEAKNRTFGLEL